MTSSMETHAKLQELVDLMNEIRREQQKRHEFFGDMIPILKSALSVGSERLQEMESKGYFRLAHGLSEISERIASHYSSDDYTRLAQGIVGILDTIRAVTQPDILTLVDDAVGVIKNPGQIKPVGIRGLFRASQDEDVQKGLAVMIEVLRHLGSGIHSLSKSRGSGGSRREDSGAASSGSSKNRLGALLGPRLRNQKMDEAKPESAGIKPSPTCSLAAEVEGIELTPDGFVIHCDRWNEEIAVKIAQAVEVENLSERHWQLIHFARQEFLNSKTSPNLRRLSVGSGCSTKDIYVLFPKTPAKTICRIAGIPKPVGCI